LWSALIGLFRSSARLDAEILVLRQQINVLRRNSPKRFASALSTDGCSLYCLVPCIVDALAIVRPERAGVPFFCNRADGIASVDLFVVPTLSLAGLISCLPPPICFSPNCANASPWGGRAQVRCKSAPTE
jgi:hypothetical protein